MPSSCRARQFLLHPGALSVDRLRDTPRFALAERDAADVRAVNASAPRDAGIQTEAGENLQADERLVGGGILESHLEAGHAVALTSGIVTSALVTVKGKSEQKEEPGLPSLPEWAVHIANLLKEQRLSQRAFAAKLNVTQASVSLWILGKSEPKPEHYFRMARIWPESTTIPFLLKRASDISGAFQVPGLDKMLGQSKKPAQSTRQVKFGRFSNEPVEIPLLKDAAAAGTPRQLQEREIDDVLPMPGSLCPHPDKIVCIRVEGDSMSPVLEPGYIVAVDTAQTDRARLYNQMVAARDPEGGVTIKWLRRSGKNAVLVPQHTSRRHPIIMLGPEEEESGWHIVGKVLWWIGMPT
jgi:SOS-response transcriptional repressor LexA